MAGAAHAGTRTCARSLALAIVEHKVIVCNVVVRKESPRWLCLHVGHCFCMLLLACSHIGVCAVHMAPMWPHRSTYVATSVNQCGGHFGVNVSEP
jgi:hypothetical protein